MYFLIEISNLNIYTVLRVLSFNNLIFHLLSKVFANSPGDRVSIPDRVLLKTQTMVLDAVMLHQAL